MARIRVTIEVDTDEVCTYCAVTQQLVSHTVMDALENFQYSRRYPRAYVTKAYSDMMNEQEIEDKIKEVTTRMNLAEAMRNAVCVWVREEGPDEQDS